MSAKKKPLPAQESPTKDRRSKGERTRERILDATLAVIADQGLRGVTHRAVAGEAGVQTSLTTYYFKDIEDLIEQAFKLFCQRRRPGYQAFWNQVFTYLDGYGRSELRKNAVREQVCADLAHRATGYLVSQVREKPQGLAVEQVFFTASTLSPTLKALATEHRDNLLAPVIELCSRFNRLDPEIDAELLLNTLSRLEYEALNTDPENVNSDAMERRVRRQLGWGLGLRGA